MAKAIVSDRSQPGPPSTVITFVRPYLDELQRVRALARAVGPNPHRWGLDPHLRKGVLVADLFTAAMIVVGLILRGVGAPLWFFPLFLLPVLAFALALLLVVAAQSRDEERIAETRKRR